MNGRVERALAAARRHGLSGVTSRVAWSGRGAEAVSRASGTLCHGDVNAANVARDDDPGRVVLLDWAGAGWLDPVWDLAAVAPAAVPPLLDGHRQLVPAPDRGSPRPRRGSARPRA